MHFLKWVDDGIDMFCKGIIREFPVKYCIVLMVISFGKIFFETPNNKHSAFIRSGYD